MLTKQGFKSKNGEFKVRVIIKGDGDELERTFDIEVADYTDIKKDFDSNKEYKAEIDYVKDYETSVIGWNLYGEETESREIFYSDIEEVIEDLNK